MSDNGRVTNQDYIDAAETLGLEFIEGEIQPGDLYLAGRNTGMKLLECESVDARHWINSTDPIGYPYDTWECRRVQVNS